KSLGWRHGGFRHRLLNELGEKTARVLYGKIDDFLIGVAALVVGGAGNLLHSVVEDAPASAQARRLFLFSPPLFLWRRHLGSGFLRWAIGFGHRGALRHLFRCIRLLA